MGDRSENSLSEQRARIPGATTDASISLDEALDELRAQLASAHARAAGTALQFPIESLTVEFKVMVARSAEGKAGFRVPVVGAELGGAGAWKTENLQTVTLVLGGPVDHDGVPQRVARASDEEKA